MITVILVHPGCTSFDIEQRIQGNLSVPLNRMGIEQVTTQASELQAKRPDVIYAPEIEPDWACAQKLGEVLETPVVATPCLQNVNMGLWQGMEVKDLHKCQPTVYKEGKEAPWNVCAPAGESLQDAKKRIVSELKKLSKKWSDDACVAIVASEPVAGVIRYVLNNGQGANPDLWNISGSQGTNEFIEISKEEVTKIKE